jgi:hypothetical protein
MSAVSGPRSPTVAGPIYMPPAAAAPPAMPAASVSEDSVHGTWQHGRFSLPGMPSSSEEEADADGPQMPNDSDEEPDHSEQVCLQGSDSL